MTSVFPIPTFRDPDGSLTLHDDSAVRTIREAARVSVLQFLGSPFCQRLQQRGDMVATSIDDSPSGLRLFHPRIAIPIYPWEWTPGQWLAAAELTLNLCEEAAAEGWILKDATPLNILFIHSRPVLVDVLSFDRRDPAASVWLAYGQYVRTFLLPLLMNRMLAWPLEMSMFRRDGYEPAELFGSLGWRQRLSRNAFLPITVPSWLEGRQKSRGAKPAATAAVTRGPELSLHLLNRTISGLRRRTRRVVAEATNSSWSEYRDTLTHYTAAQTAEKHNWLSAVIQETRPARVLDVGANTGEYSTLVAKMGVDVVAVERDAASAEQLFRSSRASNLPIHTVQADLARPTPAVGWDNNESSALLPRLEGHFDLVLMLAVIHHLLLLEQIPLSAIMDLCHRLTKRHLVVEWVPVSDPMFQDLMRGRDDLYGALTQESLMQASGGLFRLARQQVLENGRTLLLLEKEERSPTC